MEGLHLAEIAAALSARVIGTVPESASGVSTDTREDVRGALFVALRGENHDGHAYVARALAGGAAAAVVSQPVDDCPGPFLLVEDTLRAYQQVARWWRDRFAIPVVGVTGSVGKTSTRQAIAAALGSRWHVLTTEHNFNNEVGVPKTILGLNAEHGAAVIEMAMRGRGQIAALAATAHPTIGVITNIGFSHIELLGTQQAIAETKSELLQALPTDGVAVLPADDPWYAFLRDRCACRVVTFGLTEGADYRATNVAIDAYGRPSMRIVDIPIRLSNPGVHQVINTVAALAVADTLGIPLDGAAAALASMGTVEKRMRQIDAPRGFTVLDDTYNAAPDSMRAAIETLSIIAKGRGCRAVAILGDMKELGERAPELHRYVGETAGHHGVAVVMTVGELARDIAEGARQAGVPTISEEADTDAASKAAPSIVQPGDLVLVKGSRAMEMERIVEELVL